MQKLIGSRIFRWGITAGLFVIVLSQMSADQIRTVARLQNISLLLLASVVLCGVIILGSLRWRLVGQILGLDFSFGQYVLWNFIGHAFNQIFPSSVGGDVVRGIIAARRSSDKVSIVTSIALERLIGLIALLILIAIGQPLLIVRLNETSTSRLVIALLFGVAFVGVGMLVATKAFKGPLRYGIEQLSRDARRLTRSPRKALSALLIALATHCINLALTAIVANRLGANVSLLDVLLVMPTIYLVASLPISIGGWGVREAAVAVGFSALGQPVAAAVTASVIIGLANLIAAVPGACAWAFLTSVDRERDHASSARDLTLLKTNESPTRPPSAV